MCPAVNPPGSFPFMCIFRHRLVDHWEVEPPVKALHWFIILISSKWCAEVSLLLSNIYYGVMLRCGFAG